MNEFKKQMQKITGIKQGQFDSDKQRLYSACQTVLFVMKNVVEEIEKAEMTNEQFFINWLDSINEISVKY